MQGDLHLRFIFTPKATCFIKEGVSFCFSKGKILRRRYIKNVLKAFFVDGFHFSFVYML